MNVPDDRRYTQDHEWARLEDGRVRVGITDFAQDALGDVVFVQLPEPGAAIEAGGPLGEVESTKSVSDIYAPVSGTVVAVNESLEASPELINSGPYQAGWMIDVRLADDAEGVPGDLLDAAAYRELTVS